MLGFIIECLSALLTYCTFLVSTLLCTFTDAAVLAVVLRHAVVICAPLLRASSVLVGRHNASAVLCSRSHAVWL